MPDLVLPRGSRRALGLVFVLAFAHGGVGRAVAAPARPDLLLITVDTLRPDALGFLAGRNETPAIDALAASSFRFPRAVAPAPLTLPSHTSMMTGLTPRRHGVRDNGRVFPAGGAEPLAERLRAAGYTTAAFVSGFPLAATFGLDRGFERYDDRLSHALPGGLERSAAETASAALAWLTATAGDAPRFLWIHFYDPHDPYAGARSAAAADQRAAYDAEVRAVDAAVGRLLAALAGDRRPRLTVFAADHGESLGEHGESTHGFFIYQSTIEAPLLFSWPGVIPAGESAARVRLIDLAPTVLDLLALEPWPDREGISLRPAFAGRSGVAAVAHVESRRPWHSYGWAPLAAVIDGRWKLIVAPRPELYDLDADPGETTNRYDTERRVARRLADSVRELPPAVESAGQEDPATIAKLRALGYLGGPSPPATEPAAGLPDPKDRIATWNLLGEAEQALGERRDREALAGFDRVLAEEPANPFALGRSAEALIGLGEWDAARRRLEQAVEHAPTQAEIRRRLVDLLQREHRFAEAAIHWMELARQLPRDAAAWRGLGGALGRSGRPAEAVRAFESAVELRPQDAELRTQLAFAAYAAGDRRRAAAELLVAAKLAPPAAFVHSGTLGILLADEGRPREARSWLEASAPGEPDHAEARYRLALLLVAAGELDSARAALAAAIAADPRLSDRARREAGLSALR